MVHRPGTSTFGEGTLVELLRHRAVEPPDRRAYTFLVDGETEEVVRSYHGLDLRARAIAAKLQGLFSRGDRVLLLFPPGLDFLDAFFGCLYAGVVAVPAYPPRPNRPISHVANVAIDAQTKLVLGTRAMLADLEPRFSDRSELTHHQFCATEDVEDERADTWREVRPAHTDLAFLQYTSGSTSTPKGVMVTHDNLLVMEKTICDAFEHTIPTRQLGCGWLPLYHDMGLIGNALQAIYVGSQCVLMSPVAFLQKPIRWLQAIARYRATTSGGPNFAYELCVRSITSEQKKSLDLRSWDLAFTGAEPVRPETQRRFIEAFGVCGFRPQAFYPCYGLAEATLMVTGGKKRSMPTVRTFDRSMLTEHLAVALESQADDPSGYEDQARSLVGCGCPVPDTKLVIVDPETCCARKDGEIGEIWVSGPHVTSGYWNRPDATAESFDAKLQDGDRVRFMRTGDLGFLHEGELFVTGRLKDMIILRGRNYYPQDIERTVAASHPALRPDCGAAFTVDEDGDRRLAIAQEVERTSIRKLDVDQVAQAVCQAVAEEHDLQVETVLLLKTSGIPKTSSGKIQHHACLDGYVNDSLPIIGRWQRSRVSEEAKIESRAPAEDEPGSPISKTAEAIQTWLVKQLATRLGIPERQIDIQQPFARYGLDSVSAVNLAEALGQWLGRPLEPTLAYDFPNVALLARHLAGEVTTLVNVPKTSSAATENAIAVVGLGCRLPGARSPEAFWELLQDGIEAVGELPTNRQKLMPWWRQNGSDETLRGGFLDDIDFFDASFFGISPAEAACIDPQQRLLLEVAWEALEHAGIAPAKIAGSSGGVFVGISSSDYSRLSGDVSSGGVYAGTGNALSIAANRLSYVFDLRGPSWVVDTACSSSLVAIHQACQSLRRGECDFAMAGGVNVILALEVNQTLAQAGFLSPEGRCRTFDDEADGYVRGEGCGLVVLKRLFDAQRDHDRVLAVIRGSAVNQDGRSNGLTASSGPSQQDVIRRALEDAGVSPSDVGYIEAQSTGTALGDPIEINSLKQVFDRKRGADNNGTMPCWVGSVKTNIGHLEAAAGIAGLIKVVLTLANEAIPPHLHLKSLNRRIDLEGSRLAIPRSREPWTSGDRPRVAGVSSFGLGGTNAHVILEEAVPVDQGATAAVPDRPRNIFTLSAHNHNALRDAAERFSHALEAESEESLADVCHTATVGRSHLDCRLATVTDNLETLSTRLGEFVAGGKADFRVSDQSPRWERRKLAFLFTGQDSYYAGMGSELYQTHPIFRDTIDRCDAIVRSLVDQPIVTSFDSERMGDSPCQQENCSQLALFALEYALAKLWRSWGIEPGVVMGHSLGEYAAACYTGVFSLEDGLRLVAERERLTRSLPKDGRMVAVFAKRRDVDPVVRQFASQAAVAAINGREHLVISGRDKAVEEIVARLQETGIRTRSLTISAAFHSPLVEPILDEFHRFCRKVNFHPPKIQVISNRGGQPAGKEIVSPDYWCRHLREPVEFVQSLDTLIAQEIEVFLEIGPKPTLTALGREYAGDGPTRLWLRSLDKEPSDWAHLSDSLCQLYVRGAPVDWTEFDRPYARRRVPLPTYPFQRQRYWLDSTTAIVPSDAKMCKENGHPVHPLLGRRVPSAGQQTLYENRLDAGCTQFLGDHRIAGRSVVSASVFAEMALAGSAGPLNGQHWILNDLRIECPLVLSDTEHRTIQTVVSPNGGGSRSVEVFRLNDEGKKDDADWVRHCSGRVVAQHGPPESETVDLDSIRSRCPGRVTPQDFYRRCKASGFELGPSLQVIDNLWQGQWEALAEIQSGRKFSLESDAYRLNPVLFDASLQTIAAAIPSALVETTYVPVAIDSLAWFSSPATTTATDLWVHVTIEKVPEANPETLTAEVVLFTRTGQTAARIHGVELRHVAREISEDVRLPTENENNHTSRSGSLRIRLAELLPNERVDLLVDHIQGEIARVLGSPAVEVDVGQPLNHLGLDSLMAIELRNRIKSELGINLPMVRFMEGASLSELAGYLNEQFVDGMAGGKPFEHAETPFPAVGGNQPVGASLNHDWVEGEI